MLVTTMNGKMVILHEGNAFLDERKLTDDELIYLREFEILKLKYVTKGDYFSAYAIDELVSCMNENSHVYEHFAFLLGAITEIVIRREAVLDLPLFIKYMMKDIKEFKRNFNGAVKLHTLICEITTELNDSL